jgi:hypothetical protein
MRERERERERESMEHGRTAGRHTHTGRHVGVSLSFDLFDLFYYASCVTILKKPLHPYSLCIGTDLAEVKSKTMFVFGALGRIYTI